MAEKTKITIYKCKDCSFIFESRKSKLDVVCLSCESLNVDYSNEPLPKPALVEELPEHEPAQVMTPAKAGYYKAIVARKVEENNNLKEQRGWLLEQFYYLQKAVKYLETRKIVLEEAIKDLEKNILAGVPAMEQLEENDNFNQLSPKVEKKNK